MTGDDADLCALSALQPGQSETLIVRILLQHDAALREMRQQIQTLLGERSSSSALSIETPETPASMLAAETEDSLSP